MKKLLSTLIMLGAIHTNEIASQDVEEIIVVTSALIDTTEITNPLYVIDGDEIIDDATTSLGADTGSRRYLDFLLCFVCCRSHCTGLLWCTGP